MGLFKSLVIMVAGWAGLLPHQNRRSYSITLFRKPVGTFKLPRADFLPDPDAPQRNLLARPFKVDFADYFYIYWIEAKPEGGYKTTTWYPETADEREEARRFYDACHAEDVGMGGSVEGGRSGALPTRSNEELQLIRAILANRTSEEAYVNYAAFLIDRNNPYGEYIRLTLEIEKIPEGDARREKPLERRQKIVDQHGANWVRPLTDLGLFPGVHMGDLDGFMPDIWFNNKGVIEELDVPCDTSAFPNNGAKLFYGAPFLRTLSVNIMEMTLADFGRIAQMSQIEVLRASVGASSPQDLLAFAESSHLAGLRELDISGADLGPEGAATLAKARWLGGLRSLNVQSCGIQDQGLEAIVSSPAISNLETLSVASNGLSDEGLSVLAKSPHVGRLTGLSIGGNGFGGDGVRALAAAAFIPRLKSLKLETSNVDPESIRLLLAAPYSSLKTINVSFSSIGDEVLVTLATSPYFHGIEQLHAAYTGAGDNFAEAVANSGFTSLKEVELQSNQIGDRGVIALAQSKAFTKVTKLNIADNTFGPKGVKAVGSAELPMLEELSLNGIVMGKDGAVALCRNDFPKLTRLWVTGEHVGDEGKEKLTKRFGDRVGFM